MRRDYRGSHVIVYPAYLDSTLSRKKGRRVPLNLAIPNPTLEEIVKACEKLGLSVEVEQDKLYPKLGEGRGRGRVIVSKQESKLKTLYMVAQAIRELRGLK